MVAKKIQEILGWNRKVPTIPQQKVFAGKKTGDKIQRTLIIVHQYRDNPGGEVGRLKEK